MSASMRPEGNNPLDLNNLPAEDYNGKQLSQEEEEEDTSSSAGKGKSVGGGGDGKVYECRFCSLKFCKSQALGGHMNRHRQERETETLNKARQLVFTNDLAPRHLSYVPSSTGPGQPMSHMNMNDPGLPFRSMYPTRLFSNSIPPPPPPPPPPSAPYMYPSPPRLLSFHSQFPPANNDYFLGHVLSEGNNYTCVGAPVGNSSSTTQEEGMEWGRRQID